MREEPSERTSTSIYLSVAAASTLLLATRRCRRVVLPHLLLLLRSKGCEQPPIVGGATRTGAPASSAPRHTYLVCENNRLQCWSWILVPVGVGGLQGTAGVSRTRLSGVSDCL